MKKNDKIYIAGHTGLVGSSLIRHLKRKGYNNIIFKSKSELNLQKEEEVEKFLKEEKPDCIYLTAGRVGGISANVNYPAEFIYENLKIHCNVIHNAYKTGVKKLLYFGCSCLYPAGCPQPVKEEYLLTGRFEPTNEAYSVAKLAGLKMCQAYNHQYGTNFICCVADNIYGPNDNFNMEDSHVIPALIMKFHNAKVKKNPEVTIWGTGKPRRGFLYIDDLSEASIFLMLNYNSSKIVNIGSGVDVSIRELSEIIKVVVGFTGKIKFDTGKPDGMLKKGLDVQKLNSLGWCAKTTLNDGLINTYNWYLQNSL